MKMYEGAETNRRFMPLLPIYARIDGRCFSNFTRGLMRPFDPDMTDAMQSVTKFLVEETQATVGYTQSDEISLCWKNNDHEQEMFFGGKPFKYISVLAGMASARFNLEWVSRDMTRTVKLTPCFDARVFQLPNLTEAANAFLWRVNDAVKNSISMAASIHYSPRELYGKSGAQKQEMLHAKGINWNDYAQSFKEGTFFKRVLRVKQLTEEEIQRIPEPLRVKVQEVYRTVVEEQEWPQFRYIANRTGVLFGNEYPQIIQK
jgi:tRNA(His) guanylyltransferase